MTRPSLLPSRLHGQPYAAAVFCGSAGAALTLAGYTVAAASFGQERLPLWMILVEVGVVMGCAVLAWAVARGRIVSVNGLECVASLFMCWIFSAALAEMVSTPSHAENMTAHSFLVLVAAGVLIRVRWVLAALAAGGITAWTVTVQLIDPPDLTPAQWAPSWVVAVVIAFAAQAVANTERGVGQRIRRDALRTSWRDELTGLTNRHGFTPQAQQILGQSRRRGEPVWCAFVDVDHFKSVNDLLGHDAGDAVLVAVADAVRNVARSSDLACRWGGDEFVLLGSGAPPEERALERRVVDYLARSLDPQLLASWTPAVTAGVAGVTADVPDRLAELMVAADHRMYARRRAMRTS